MPTAAGQVPIFKPSLGLLVQALPAVLHPALVWGSVVLSQPACLHPARCLLCAVLCLPADECSLACQLPSSHVFPRPADFCIRKQFLVRTIPHMLEPHPLNKHRYVLGRCCMIQTPQIFSNGRNLVGTLLPCIGITTCKLPQCLLVVGMPTA